MNTHTFILGLAMLVSGYSHGAACDVFTRSQSSAVPSVETHTCYQFTGVPPDAINWSCGNESKEMLTSEKRRVAQCQTGSVGRCTATLTQEGLTNPHSTSKVPGQDSPNIPQGAQVVTYYYQTAHLPQARKDCEMAGGRWE